ncbi:MAG: nitroreductase family protein [Nitrospiraceae bacterium]|nr:nitroreductase family protein [Nitrospiraceae bacterium]
MENEVLEVIYTRRSVRSFTGQAIPRESLLKILKAGMAAPSARNIQPWAFVAVTERGLLDSLCERLPYAKMLDKAGAAVIVCGVPGKDEVYGGKYQDENRIGGKYWVMDSSAAAENILLACHAMGLGAVWTAAYPYENRMAAVRDIIGVPEDVMPLAVIPVGVPKDKGKVTDKFKEDNIRWERW